MPSLPTLSPSYSELKSVQHPKIPCTYTFHAKKRRQINLSLTNFVCLPFPHLVYHTPLITTQSTGYRTKKDYNAHVESIS